MNTRKPLYVISAILLVLLLVVIGLLLALAPAPVLVRAQMLPTVTPIISNETCDCHTIFLPDIQNAPNN